MDETTEQLLERMAGFAGKAYSTMTKPAYTIAAAAQHLADVKEIAKRLRYFVGIDFGSEPSYGVKVNQDGTVERLTQGGGES